MKIARDASVPSELVLTGEGTAEEARRPPERTTSPPRSAPRANCSRPRQAGGHERIRSSAPLGLRSWFSGARRRWWTAGTQLPQPSQQERREGALGPSRLPQWVKYRSLHSSAPLPGPEVAPRPDHDRHSCFSGLTTPFHDDEAGYGANGGGPQPRFPNHAAW
jgi:hypothetical protein